MSPTEYGKQLRGGSDGIGTAPCLKKTHDSKGENQTMAMKERMHTGELYLPGDEEIMKEQAACL